MKSMSFDSGLPIALAILRSFFLVPLCLGTWGLYLQDLSSKLITCRNFVLLRSSQFSPSPSLLSLLCSRRTDLLPQGRKEHLKTPWQHYSITAKPINTACRVNRVGNHKGQGGWKEAGKNQQQEKKMKTCLDFFILTFCQPCFPPFLFSGWSLVTC